MPSVDPNAWKHRLGLLAQSDPANAAELPLQQYASTTMRVLLGVMLLAGTPAVLAQSCPPLQSYYPATNPAPQGEWLAKLPAIESLLESCLTNAEYFALLGAARLNSGQVPAAIESLERALLLDPQHGAAQIDYAEALYISGQLFPAIEMNDALLARPDLPANLRPVLAARQQIWRRQTYRQQFMVEATTGYDTNLNGAPTRGDLTLTFGGTPVTLTLDPQYRPVEGAFGNLRLGGVWQWLAPTHQHDLVGTARARVTDDGDTQLAQAEWRYGVTWPGRARNWALDVGSSHMNFGGNALYSVAEATLRHGWSAGQRCQPSVEGGLQTLHYHGQSLMNGLETSLTASLACRSDEGRHQWRADVGGLYNAASQDVRPGGDRTGWNLRLAWQYQRGKHLLAGQFSYARVLDAHGYSPLLANGATREVGNRTFSFRYQWAFREGVSLVAGMTHQEQDSNLQPFQNRGTVTEVGLLLNF